MATTLANIDIIRETINNYLVPLGFESYPFKVGWYNDKVDNIFSLNYAVDTVAFIFLSTPAMFDKTFKPFIARTDCSAGNDPIDQCMADCLGSLKNDFIDQDIDIIYDYELDHMRRPKILVQSAGHVAGACPYYQRNDVKEDPWGDKKIFGMSIHPKYGGWFAFRGVAIFKNIKVPDLPQIEPPDVLPTDEMKIDALNRFNGNWQDWTFRDVIPVESKYSEEQKEYFATLPKDRKQLIEKLREK